jgi:hypothetical protein
MYLYSLQIEGDSKIYSQVYYVVRSDQNVAYNFHLSMWATCLTYLIQGFKYSDKMLETI